MPEVYIICPSKEELASMAKAIAQAMPQETSGLILVVGSGAQEIDTQNLINKIHETSSSQIPLVHEIKNIAEHYASMSIPAEEPIPQRPKPYFSQPKAQSISRPHDNRKKIRSYQAK